jgi:hypothetical protein
MDQISVDTVGFIEDDHIQERKLDGSLTVDWLRHSYLDQGRWDGRATREAFPPPFPKMHIRSGPTDRGEHPMGSSPNRIPLLTWTQWRRSAPEIPIRHFHGSIRLKADSKCGVVEVTDLGGSVSGPDCHLRRLG